MAKLEGDARRVVAQKRLPRSEVVELGKEAEMFPNDPKEGNNATTQSDDML